MKSGRWGSVVKVEVIRYSKPRVAQVVHVRRRHFKVGTVQWVRICRRSSVGRVSIMRVGWVDFGSLRV